MKHFFEYRANSLSSRTLVRLVTFLCAALTVSLIACPLSEMRYTRAERAQLDMMRRGIDILCGAVQGIADGEDPIPHIRAANTALTLLPLDGDTSASLAHFLETAASISHDSADMTLITDYAAALYGRLCLLSDFITSSQSDSIYRDTAAMTPTLMLSLPLPLLGDTVFTEHAKEDSNAEIDAPEISEAEARDRASSVIGVNIGLRLNYDNRTIPEVYSFTCSNAFIDITKYGGYLLRYSLAITPDAAKLTTGEALQLTDKFVYARGHGSIELYDAYEDGGFLWTVYKKRGDGENGAKIKAGIALDTGKICFYDASEFITDKQQYNE